MRRSDLIVTILLQHHGAFRGYGGGDRARAGAIAEDSVLGADPIADLDAFGAELSDALGQSACRGLKGVRRTIHVLMIIIEAVAGLQGFEHIDRCNWSNGGDL